MKNLLIVESGAKAATISKYLNTKKINDKYGVFKVVASFGHIRDVVKKKKDTVCGIDVQKWTPIYQLMKEKSKTIKLLREEILKSDMIWLASDLDYEGEQISFSIKEVFKIDKFRRITFNEITQDAIINAIENPRDIDYNMVDAQTSRRILDRIIGFKLTQILWNNFDTFSKVSAGRVQSVLLRILCENEDKINSFKSREYWNAFADFKCGTLLINETRFYDDNMMIKKFTSNHDILQGLEQFAKASFFLDKKRTQIKQISEKPKQPFITSTLQQEAHSKLGFSSKFTMKLAQELYESGHITYIRTDSTSLSSHAIQSAKIYICKTYKPSDYKNYEIKKNSKSAQEAHECIRPSVFVKDIGLTSTDQTKLYELIFNRTIASLMQPAVYEELNVHITLKDQLTNRALYGSFIGKTKALVYQGFLLVYNNTQDASLLNALANILESREKIVANKIVGNNVWVTPYPHFNESKVIKTLEALGIGRPSTFSSILDKLFKNQFIEIQDLKGDIRNFKDYVLNPKNNQITEINVKKSFYSEKNSIIPTVNGQVINKYLVENFKSIINVEFTNLMETELDSIANGNKKIKNVMQSFYDPFITECNKHKNTAGKYIIQGYSKQIKIADTLYNIRLAKFGPVIQFENNNKMKYINLTPYLDDTDKKLENINENDINILVDIPFQIDSNRILQYGRYGFYIVFKLENKSIRIYKNQISQILQQDFESFVLKKE
jgi:DNA topoisomerase-1